MPVHVTADKAEVKTNEIYVLPPNAPLRIESGHLQLAENTEGRRGRKPIDVLLSTLAMDLGELAVGVILSGGHGDDTLGVKAIKERGGGLTMAQTANHLPPQYPDMPRSAIASGMVDLAAARRPTRSPS